MPRLIAIHGDWDSGKTTTCLRLSRYFKPERKVACIQFEKGINDVGLYWAEWNNHYSLPLEVAKGKDVFENWLPVGYDLYILEGKNPEAGIMSRILYQIFPDDDQNICVPWSCWSGVKMRDGPHPIITMCRPDQIPIEHPAVDWFQTLFGPEEMKQIPIEPKLIMPRFTDQVLALGYFPGEWYDMYPSLTWCQNDTERFYERIGSTHYDLIILGWMNEPDASICTLQEIKNIPTISYDPRLFFSQLTEFSWEVPEPSVLEEARRIVLNEPVGTRFPDEGYLKKYQNEYWTQMFFQEIPLIVQDGMRTIINGWVHPMYLYRDGLIPGRIPVPSTEESCSQLQPRTPQVRRRR